MLPIQRKGRARNFAVKPFPHDIGLINGYFTGYDVEVFDEISIKSLHASCFGLNPKPRQMVTYSKRDKLKKSSEAEYNRRLEWKEKFNDPAENTVDEMMLVGDSLVPDPYSISQSLVLFLEEAFFLHCNLSCLQICDLDGKVLQTDDIWRKFCKLKETFVECFVSYLYLKSKNWVIKSGIKFGGDFLLYKQSPQLYHASFIIIVSRTGAKSSREYHTNERIAETTGKNLLYLEVYFPDEIQPSEYLKNLELFKVKEVLIHRHEMRNKVN